MLAKSGSMRFGLRLGKVRVMGIGRGLGFFKFQQTKVVFLVSRSKNKFYHCYVPKNFFKNSLRKKSLWRPGLGFKFKAYLLHIVCFDLLHSHHPLLSHYRRWLNKVINLKIHWWFCSHCLKICNFIHNFFKKQLFWPFFMRILAISYGKYLPTLLKHVHHTVSQKVCVVGYYVNKATLVFPAF